MSVITWIGLGKMGLPMAKQLLAAGHEVRGIEINETVAALAIEAGIPSFPLGQTRSPAPMLLSRCCLPADTYVPCSAARMESSPRSHPTLWSSIPPPSIPALPKNSTSSPVNTTSTSLTHQSPGACSVPRTAR
ncbi:MAG: hypothetical protein DI630_12060 [Gordonia sp. (in: high G+C Gram-positive bacteria)]|nr:MAG: hypothetical protein DI630_12060 [Gordonia sp. (in: high G+C Gram-positive bacteria)]